MAEINSINLHVVHHTQESATPECLDGELLVAGALANWIEADADPASREEPSPASRCPTSFILKNILLPRMVRNEGFPSPPTILEATALPAVNSEMSAINWKTEQEIALERD